MSFPSIVSLSSRDLAAVTSLWLGCLPGPGRCRCPGHRRTPCLPQRGRRPARLAAVGFCFHFFLACVLPSGAGLLQLRRACKHGTYMMYVDTGVSWTSCTRELATGLGGGGVTMMLAGTASDPRVSRFVFPGLCDPRRHQACPCSHGAGWVLRLLCREGHCGRLATHTVVYPSHSLLLSRLNKDLFMTLPTLVLSAVLVRLTLPDPGDSRHPSLGVKHPDVKIPALGPLPKQKPW